MKTSIVFLPVITLALTLSACGDTTEVNETAPTELAEPVPVSDFARVDPSAETIGEIDDDGCNAALARPYVGQEAGANTRGELLSAVAPVTNVRWIGPDDEVTEDLVADRLNVTLSADDTITGANCG